MDEDRTPPLPLPVCPGCSRSDHAYKVSRIYVEGTAYLRGEASSNRLTVDSLLSEMLPDGSASEHQGLVSRLVRDLAPPSGRTQVTRRIHPDWMIVFLCAVGLVIAFQVFRTEPGSFPVIVTFLAAALLVYLFARRPVLERYTAQSRQDADDKRRVEREVGRWMRLYLCTREPCVFDPETNRLAPIDQMRRLFGE